MRTWGAEANRLGCGDEQNEKARYIGGDFKGGENPLGGRKGIKEAHPRGGDNLAPEGRAGLRRERRAVLPLALA
jgi:hypothetical protein